MRLMRGEKKRDKFGNPYSQKYTPEQRSGSYVPRSKVEFGSSSPPKRDAKNLDSFKDGCDLKPYKSNRKVKKGVSLKESREISNFVTNIKITNPVSEAQNERSKSGSHKRSDSQEYSKKKDINSENK